MHILWTPEQALGLAPDRYSLKMGRTFAQPDRWSNLGCNQQAAWGEFPVSGKPPFRTRLNLAELRFDCSCFNRKFPCTHSVSLLLLLEALLGPLLVWLVLAEFPGHRTLIGGGIVLSAMVASNLAAWQQSRTRARKAA